MVADSGIGPADGGAPPSIPSIDNAFTPVPYPVTKLEGRAPDSRRIIVRGGDNPVAKAVLPDGSFCIDVPMPDPGTYDFEIVGQSMDGVFSEPAMVQIVFDPASAPIPGLTLCSGQDPAGCAGSSEICDDGRDNDCNGLADMRDPACSDCVDDVFEPNDDVNAPRADPGRYEGLTICPGNSDYYGIYANAGDTIRATIYFSQASGDLDLELLGIDHTTVLATSATMTDDEVVSYDATDTGEYKLLVWGPDGSMNGYTLVVDVTSP